MQSELLKGGTGPCIYSCAITIAAHTDTQTLMADVLTMFENNELFVSDLGQHVLYLGLRQFLKCTSEVDTLHEEGMMAWTAKWRMRGNSEMHSEGYQEYQLRAYHKLK